MEKIDAQVKILAQCIRDSQTYRNYRVQVEKIEKQTGLLEQINEFRRKNFELQSVEPSENMLDKIDAFNKEYESFRESPLVSDFLQAELDLCRLMQRIQMQLTEAIDFISLQ